jgi:hypothetical protein
MLILKMPVERNERLCMRRQKTKEERLFDLSTKCFADATAGRYSLVGTSEFVASIGQLSGSLFDTHRPRVMLDFVV